MQFKLFGPDLPPVDFRKDLEAFLSLDTNQWQTITDWFLSTENFDSENALSDERIAASTLLPEQFVTSADVIYYILGAWHQYQLELRDIQRDLLLLGCTPEQVERVGKFLEPLGQVKARVFEDNAAYIHEGAVLPALEGVNFVCDMRAIFEDYPYPPPRATKMRHTSLLGLRPVVLMEILTEDSFGGKQKLAFQMNEREFEELCEALKRARDQLDVLKAQPGILPQSRS